LTELSSLKQGCWLGCWLGCYT